MTKSADCERVDVIVVGAGPTGLLAAVELRLGGARVLVLERLAAPSTTIKALAVGPLGSEALQRRGMAAAIADGEERSFAAMERLGANPRGRMSTFSGHFGFLFIRRDAQQEPERRMHFVDQQGIEAMLGDRVRALGIEVRRQCEVASVVQQEDGVDVEWSSPTGGGRLRCAYIVACDGGRSTIRKTAGFDFPGTPPTMTMYQAVAQIDHPERLSLIGWRRTPGGMIAYGPFPNRVVLMDFSGPPADRLAPVTREEVETVLRRVSGADVRVTALETANRWTDNTRLVDTYRKGRVLLAGDAAHIHSPFGGQGLSLGLADAANLGWKLAAVVRGEMPESLLDTYTAERRPVAEAVLANTLAQAAIMRPDPQSGAMRDIVANLMQFDDVGRCIGEMMSGLATRYDFGSEQDDVGRLIGDRPIRQRKAQAEAQLSPDNGSLYGLMQDGMGVLLDASAGGTASKLVAAGTRNIRCVPVDTGPSMLIRPDACVAWADAESGCDGLDDALHRWFIPPPHDVRMARSA